MEVSNQIFYFIRHGLQTDSSEDPSLSQMGKEQAKKVTGTIQSYRFQTIFSSTLRRAQETKKIILKGGGPYVDILRDELQENESVARKLLRNESGEDVQQFLAKISNVLNEVFEANQLTLIVAHLGTFLGIGKILKIKNITPSNFPDNCQLICYSKVQNVWKVNFFPAEHKTMSIPSILAVSVDQPPSAMVQIFHPPGFANDLQAEERQGWHDFINSQIKDAKRGSEWITINGKRYKILNNAPRENFFNPSNTAKLPDYAEKKIAWFAFPKLIKDSSPSDKTRWKKADSSRDVQDEYCEWSVLRNNDKKIVKVTFTCEGPEYWDYLAETNPKKVVELYKKYVSDEVREEDLFEDGKYIVRNKWNKDTQNGAMHLIQINNTLGAEIELAAGSSMVREKDGRILTEQQELIKCGKYGAEGRNSDPLIGWEVNSLCQKGAMVSLKDPIGLYIDLEEFKTDGWETPDGTNAREFMKIARGTEECALRAIFEVPKEKGFVVGDIKINGKPIEYGAMIADFIRIKLVGIAQNFDNQRISKFGCVKLIEVPSHANTHFHELEAAVAFERMPGEFDYSGQRLDF